MHELHKMVGNILQWKHLPISHRYTLEAENSTALAAMHWPGSLGARAFVVTPQERWTIYRQGIFTPQIVVQDTHTQEVCALLTRGPGLKGELTLSNHQSYRWTPANFFRSTWAWKTAQGKPIAHYTREGQVRLEGQAGKEPQLPLLTILGCFLMTLQGVESRTAFSGIGVSPSYR